MIKENIPVVLASVLATMVALSPVAYMAYKAMPPKVVSVDLQRLVEDEQKKTIDLLSSSNGVINDEQREKIARQSTEFAKKLSEGIEQIGAECKCVIVNKAALLGGEAPDYTDIVRDLVKR